MLEGGIWEMAGGQICTGGRGHFMFRVFVRGFLLTLSACCLLGDSQIGMFTLGSK